MSLNHWGLAVSPFRQSTAREGGFFISSMHEEALARLDFLVQQGRELGILSGCEGSGKTTLMEVFARQTQLGGERGSVVNLLGLEVRELLWSLAAALSLNPGTQPEPFQLWRRISDRIEERHLLGLSTVLLLDDADQASHDTLLQLLRLLKTQAGRLTVVLGVESSRLFNVGSDLLQLSQLRIQLEPWDRETVRDYLRFCLNQAGAEKSVFDDSAIAHLWELTDGIPRWVSQLAELALLAGAGRQAKSIDAKLIESVYQELSAVYHEPAEHHSLRAAA